MISRQETARPKKVLLVGKLADCAARKTRPPGADRRIGACLPSVAGRGRPERIERRVTISNEALTVLVRFWLTSTPLPDTTI